MNWNGWRGKTWGTQYISFWPLPGLELTWVPGNCSAHAELHWLLWEGRLNFFFPKKPKPYEEFTPEHHRFFADTTVMPVNTDCRQCGKPSEHPVHLHPYKVYDCDDANVQPMLGSIAAILCAALTVDWGVKMYQLESRWPFVLFVEPSESTDGLELLQAMEPYRCAGVLIQFVGRETPEPTKEDGR